MAAEAGDFRFDFGIDERGRRCRLLRQEQDAQTGQDEEEFH
jgi:hypothetical protein